MTIFVFLIIAVTLGTLLRLNEQEYLEMRGLNVMLAHDYYPESHQGGVGIIQNGLRVATNGDLRLEPSPGQWAPVPKVGAREIDRTKGEIRVRMAYPDEEKDRKGFNPIDYPDLEFAYVVRVLPEGRGFRIVIDLEAPLPAEWEARVGLNLELFPGYLFGKTYAADGGVGIFPRQANGPGAYDAEGEYQIEPLTSGRRLVVAPEDARQRMTIEVVRGGELQLLDGRGRHNNGWFVVRSLIEPGATTRAAEWRVTPHAIPDWMSAPVVQVSQVGYHPRQAKIAVIELDPNDAERPPVQLLRVHEGGLETVIETVAAEWGRFMRYAYLQFDFTAVRQPGMYVVRYGAQESSPFRIGEDVYARHVWQPTVDTFLPVQMCHMRVVENYRVWHGACHLDDAQMAPVDLNHFDGYVQGPSTLTSFTPGDSVPNLDHGGWHDAGDYDLRIESQADTVHGLALAYERFGLEYDETTVDQANRLVQLRRPDGKPDVLQQVEHGALWIVNAYRSLGRLPRGVIEPTLEQYVHLGDAATQTDNVAGNADDRWVFTEENPGRELATAAALAAAARVLPRLNGDLARECQVIAEELYDRTVETTPLQRLALAVELLQTSGDSRYEAFLLKEAAAAPPERMGWLLARTLELVKDEAYRAGIRASLAQYRERVAEMERRTPYGMPYEPDIWGAGWGIQRFGVQQYWLYACCPDIFPSTYMFHALNFVLGCHPGPNNVSFVSGVGSRSLIPGYGVNRADFSYIPGGSGSGTALIRPDFPELLEWPYLWQQTEYCMGHPTADYVFLVAAADAVLSAEGGKGRG